MEELRKTAVDVEKQIDNEYQFQDHIPPEKSGGTRAYEHRGEKLEKTTDLIHERMTTTQAEEDRVGESYLRRGVSAHVASSKDAESYVFSAPEIDDMILLERDAQMAETGTLHKFKAMEENAFPKASDIG